MRRCCRASRVRRVLPRSKPTVPGTIVGTVPLSDRYIALVLWLNTVIHELGIPLPLTPTALLAGAQVSEGAADATTLVLVITAGTLMGNSVWFAAGRLFGSRVVKALCKISLSPDTCVGRTELAFTKWGRWSMVFGHFIPGISLVAPPLAGALGIRWSVFLGLTAIGGALYGNVLIGVGMLLSDGILSLADTVLTHGLQSAGIVFVLCAAYVAWRWRRRHLAAQALQVPRISAAQLQQALRETPSLIVVDVRGDPARRSSPHTWSGRNDNQSSRSVPCCAPQVVTDRRLLRLPERCVGSSSCPRPQGSGLFTGPCLARGSGCLVEGSGHPL
jgi:membrane protein DedA with SNARE-associated domain